MTQEDPRQRESRIAFFISSRRSSRGDMTALSELEEHWQMCKCSLIERNKYMFNNALISDVEFLLKDSSGASKTIPAHKYILSISSPVFFAMFHGKMPELGDPVEIPDSDAESFLELLRFIYYDETKLTGSNACMILYLSKKYMIPSLSEKCAEFLQGNLDASNVFAVLPGAYISDEATVVDKCWEIVDGQTKEVIDSDAFLHISQELLSLVLKRDTLSASEVDIFNAVDKWCKNQCEKQNLEVTGEFKRTVLGDAVYLIRFPLMAESEFASLVSKTKLLAMEDISAIFLYFNNALLESPLKFSQTHRRAWSSYKDSWKLIYHNDADGKTLAGSKSALMAAVSSGARVRVFIESFLEGGFTTTSRYSTETDNLSIQGCHVHAQLLQNVSKAGWDAFQDDAYWWWLIVSTEGAVHSIGCYVGANTLRGGSNSCASIKWFVKPVLSPAVYSNDKKGNSVAGSLTTLRTAIQNGYDIRGFSNKDYSFPMQTITILSDAGYMAGQTVDHISQKQSSGPLRFQSNPYWWLTIVTTEGERDMSRWTVGTHQSRGHTNDKVATDWFADTCWKHVYTHDADGTHIAGSCSALVKAIHDGQRVRFQIPDRNFFTAEADNLTIRNGHVTAQILKNAGKASLSKFEDDVFWLWLMVSTTGAVHITRYDIGDVKHRGDGINKFKVKWFVDSRAWHQVLSNDKDGNVLVGSRVQLIDAVKSGAAVRCFQETPTQAFSFQAQNLEISPDEQHVAAQTLNQVSTVEVLGLDEMRFQSNAYWWFTIVSTTGKRDISQWTVGKHVERGHSSDSVATKWFVNH